MIDPRARETQENALTLAMARGMAGTFGIPDDNFRIDFINALLRGGIHLTQIDPGRLNDLVDQAWSDPTINADWNSQQYDMPGAPTFESYLQKSLFSDSNSPILTLGLGLKQEQGQKLTTSQIRALGSSAEAVPTPFDAQFFPDTTLTYGEQFGSETEAGIDYAMPVGTALYTPFAGTISTEDDGRSNWGKRVFVTLDNGYTFAIGHMTNFSVVDGQRVNPGELLGESGGGVDDPSSGFSTGPHVEIQWIGTDGSFQDPTGIMASIYDGTTFSKLGLEGAVGSGVNQQSVRERLEGIDPYLNAKYPTAVGLWKQYFGRTPTGAEVLRVAGHGNAQQQEDYIRGLPSHIPGMNLGQYVDVRTAVDGAMQKALGHSGTDGMVKELFDRGATAPGEINHFINTLSESALNQMGAISYNAYHAANAPYMAGLYGHSTGFDPRIAQAQHKAAGAQPVTNTQAALAAQRWVPSDEAGYQAPRHQPPSPEPDPLQQHVTQGGGGYTE